jgi:hypothetical protein
MQKTLFLTVICVLALVGCDHSTNNLEPPLSGQLRIISPSTDSIVDGNVVITVDVSTLPEVKKIELYLNGELSQTRTAPPWQFEWNTSGLQSNTVITLTTKAYLYNSGYTMSQPVAVRTK